MKFYRNHIKRRILGRGNVQLAVPNETLANTDILSEL